MNSSWPLAGDGSYGPDALGALNQAFDNAWVEIATNFGNDPLELKVARNKLADALIKAAAHEGCADAESLMKAALRTMALSYVRSRPF